MTAVALAPAQAQPAAPSARPHAALPPAHERLTFSAVLELRAGRGRKGEAPVRGARQDARRVAAQRPSASAAGVQFVDLQRRAQLPACRAAGWSRKRRAKPRDRCDCAEREGAGARDRPDLRTRCRDTAGSKFGGSKADWRKDLPRGRRRLRRSVERRGSVAGGIGFEGERSFRDGRRDSRRVAGSTPPRERGERPVVSGQSVSAERRTLFERGHFERGPFERRLVKRRRVERGVLKRRLFDHGRVRTRPPPGRLFRARPLRARRPRARPLRTRPPRVRPLRILTPGGRSAEASGKRMRPRRLFTPLPQPAKRPRSRTPPGRPNRPQPTPASRSVPIPAAAGSTLRGRRRCRRPQALNRLRFQPRRRHLPVRSRFRAANPRPAPLRRQRRRRPPPPRSGRSTSTSRRTASRTSR